MNRFTYDVFLSFRGEDTRHGFTGNLWKALEDRGIRTFIDDEEIRKGEEITPSLLKAIEQSRMVIVVLSQNYATSSFCLDELSHILDCIKGKGRMVWPVFYEVDPSDVRWVKGTYGEAMAAHEKSSRFKTDTLQKWQNALHQVANLSGTHYKWKNGDGYQYKFIEKIVKEVSREIKPFTLYVPDSLVGLKHQMKDVRSLLDVGSNDEVRMVGIHGIGGIGKTTLALTVYNSIADEFDGSCFLDKVKENSEKHDLTYLQKIVLFKTVREKKIELTSVNEGIAVIQRRLQRKKVLLILDDVDKLEQLQAIVGESKWFGQGSRVIITTRDKGLLTSHGVESTYEMKELNKEDALELLRQKALRTNKVCPSSAYVLNLLKRAVTYAFGIPLALEVIGSHLSKKRIEEWQDALDQYGSIPIKEITKVLQESFSDLEKDEQRVFLDIACCLNGLQLAKVEKILHAHYGDSKNDHIRVLVEKSLIKISGSGNVVLHDLIEDMGKEIVKQESREDPGKRSRLWCAEDIVQVLEENMGSRKIEMIYLDSMIFVKWDEEAFKKMENLRTLVIGEIMICGGPFSRSPKYLPNSLRMLKLKLYPYGKKQGIWQLTYWKFASIVPRDLFKKKFEDMRVLNFDHYSHLTKIPDVSGLPNLEEFSFQNCEELITVDDSMGLLHNLKILRANHCRKLMTFPSLKLASLEELGLSHCTSLKSFPPVVWLVDKLKVLHADNCSNLCSFPPLKLASLEHLDLSCCVSLESFPPVVDGFLGKLKILRADHCGKVRSFPPLKLVSLEELHLSGCVSLEGFPPVVDGLLCKLKILHAYDCRKLGCFPPLKLASLEQLHLSGCVSLESFPPVVDGFLGKLKSLRADNCWKLRSFPPLLKLASLEMLNFSYCVSLENFPPVVDGLMGELRILLVDHCFKLRSFPPLKLTSLERLDLSYCVSLESFPPVVDGLLGKLKILCADHCRELRSFPPLKLVSLEQLHISHCDSLEGFPPVVDGWLGKLKILHVDHCRELTSFPPLKLESLEELCLSGCVSLEGLPTIVDGLLDKLKILDATGCGNLSSILPINLPSLEQLYLSCCDFPEGFPEIVGEMNNIIQLRFYNTSIKELPLSFQNLTQLQTLYLYDCGVVQLPSSIVLMSELRELTIEKGGWQFPIEEEGEGKVSPMRSSQVKFLHLRNCNLSCESLAIGLKWFANVKELDLSGSKFTILPECIEKCHFLWKLVLDNCEELQDIKGIPPGLKTLSASNCISLTSSCKSKLLNQGIALG